MMSTISLALIGAATIVIKIIHERHGADVAESWNVQIALGLAILYTVANVCLFVPVLMTQQSVLKLARSADTPQLISMSVVRAHGFSFVPLHELESSRFGSKATAGSG